MQDVRCLNWTVQTHGGPEGWSGRSTEVAERLCPQTAPNQLLLSLLSRYAPDREVAALLLSALPALPSATLLCNNHCGSCSVTSCHHTHHSMLPQSPRPGRVARSLTPPNLTLSFSISFQPREGNDDRYVTNVQDVRYSVFESLIRSLGSRRLELHRKFPKAESLKVCSLSVCPSVRPPALPSSLPLLAPHTSRFSI